MTAAAQRTDEAGRLRGKVAIVTGGGQGIGEAIGRRFAREQCAVVIAELDANHASRVAAAIVKEGGRALGVVTDVADAAQVEACVATAVEAFGPPTILVNNAGIAIRSDPLALSEAAWRRCFAVDLDGAWHATRSVLPHMLAAGIGSIVNIGSVHAFQIVPHYFPYPVAKHALIGLTRAIAIEYAARGVRCNTVCPGAVATPINTAIWAAAPDPAAERQRWSDIHPMRRIAEPDEIAAAVLFLASDESSFITAANLMVDGGRSALYHD